MSSPLVKTLGVLLAVIALALGFGLAVTKKQNNELLISEDVGIVYPVARDIGEFTLVDFNGQPIDQNRFKEKWWLVYFGFTYCPDACPVALNDMKKIKASLADELGQHVGFAFISVDPGRDTPARLKDYVQYFHPDFYAATGEPSRLEELATRVGVVFIVPEHPETEDYIVDHSTFMLLWDPEVRLKALFKIPHQADKVAAGIERIIDAS